MIKFAKTTEFRNGGNNFTIYHWPVTKVIRNMPAIARFFAVPAGTIMGSQAAGPEGLQDALPTAILYLAEQMDGGGTEQLLDILLEGVEVNSMAMGSIDDVFGDDPIALFELVKQILVVNYGAFFTQRGFGSLRDLMQSFGMVKQVQGMEPEAED